MPTLWRNGVLLGEIVEPPGKTLETNSGGIHGLLKPTPAFTGIEPMMQSRVPIFPGNPTFQNVIDRTILGQRRASSSGNESVGKFVVKELTPMSRAEARGVSADKLLEIRDDAGSVQDYDFISLHCHVVPEDAPLAEVEKHWGPTGETREHWLVHAYRHSNERES